MLSLFTYSLLTLTVLPSWSLANLFTNNACKNFLDYPIAPISPNCYNNPNVWAQADTLVKRGGYPFETHTLVTSDEYILNMFRLPRSNAQPVFLQHGLLVNSIIYVNKKQRSLAFYLYNKGYDVWLGNVRGTTYSSGHMNYTLSDKRFWDFNLDTMSLIDTPESLQYIADKTGKAGEIVYIGHSLGTTLPYMFAAGKPEQAQSLLSGIISMAPIAYLNNSPTAKRLVPIVKFLRAVAQLTGDRSLFRHEKLWQITMTIVCRIAPYGCLEILNVAYGKDPKQLPPEDLLLLVASSLTRTTSEILVQFLQMYETRRFQKYDYGTTRNRELYGQDKPPAYDLRKIKLPVIMLYGNNDDFSTLPDIERLYTELGSKVKQIIGISRNGSIPYNHFDFMYGKDIETLLYPYIVQPIAQYMGKSDSK